jgi:hypothetical protein
MIPWTDYRYWSAMAEALDCLLFWHVFPNGDFQPYMMPWPAKAMLPQ